MNNIVDMIWDWSPWRYNVRVGTLFDGLLGFGVCSPYSQQVAKLFDIKEFDVVGGSEIGFCLDPLCMHEDHDPPARRIVLVPKAGRKLAFIGEVQSDWQTPEMWRYFLIVPSHRRRRIILGAYQRLRYYTVVFIANSLGIPREVRKNLRAVSASARF